MDNITPECLIALATLYATELAKGKTKDELTHLKSFYNTVNNVLTTILIERK